mgnify:CR=1 FL=1
MDNNNQSYEDFISTVSHELRTPLTSIRGFSQTMLASWDKIDDTNKKKFIKIIEEQSQRLINLVENMLAVTKLQSKNMLVYNEIDIKSVIEQTILIIKTKYPDQLFEFSCPENVPNLFADKDKFQQIIVNLLENSAKYSPDSSTTYIRAKSQNNDVLISVENLGLPIEQKDYDKIFTKFSRIDNPLTRKVQGSGLGLYITKTLVEKMGGSIAVETLKTDNKNYDRVIFTVKMPIRTIEEQTKIKCNQ